MTRDEVYEHLTSIFGSILGRDDVQLEDETTASDVDGWDSLSHVTIIVAVEKAFGLKISTRDAKKLRNVGTLVDLILEKTA